MSGSQGVGLPEALERAAHALPQAADAIRPANGDPQRLLEVLGTQTGARVLGWLLSHEPVDGEELAEAWADEAPGIEALRAVDAAALPKAGRKALRRVEHRLRSRGVALGAPAPAPLVAKLPPVKDRLEEALLSPIDPTGVRLAFLATEHPAGGARLFEIVLDEARGVLDCRVYAAGRSKVRQLLRDFRSRGSLAGAPVPPDALRALVARVAAGQSERVALPRTFREWRAEVASAPEGTPTPGDLARERLPGPFERGLLEALATRVRAGELGPWPPAPERLAPVAQRLSEASSGVLVVSPAARGEQLDARIAESLPELFDESFGALTAHRLDETAYLLLAADREEEARACRAGAEAFREGAAAENPVARAMLERVLAPVLDKAREGVGEAEQAALVTPASAERGT